MAKTFQTQNIPIAQGDTHKLFSDGVNVNASRWYFSITGPGTADIQPIFAGNSTHKAETVLNDSVILNLAGVQQWEISASGGQITATVSGFD